MFQVTSISTPPLITFPNTLLVPRAIHTRWKRPPGKTPWARQNPVGTGWKKRLAAKKQAVKEWDIQGYQQWIHYSRDFHKGTS